MSITRRPTLCQDFPLGIGEVNAAIDNNAGLYEAWSATHSTGKINITNVNPLLAFGRHNDPLVARSAVDFVVDSTSGTPALTTTISGPAIFGAPVRLGVGSWQISVSGLQLFGATANFKWNPAFVTPPVGKALVFAYYPNSGPTVLLVNTVTLSGTAFVAVDYDFSLVVWGLV